MLLVYGNTSPAVQSDGAVTNDYFHTTTEVYSEIPPLNMEEISTVNSESLTYSLIVLLITVSLIVTSVLTILVIVTSDSLNHRIVGHYLISLAVTDLLCGTLLTPISIYAALDPHWQFANASGLCKAEAYLGAVLWASCVYIFVWTGIDRHSALMKPARYEAENTLTRCKCWIIFAWIAAILLCCPTLFFEDDKKAKYNRNTFLCHPNWTAIYPYSITLAVLVIVPSTISVCRSYSYIFRSGHSRNLDESQKSLLDHDSTYFTTFLVIVSFVVSWLPYLTFKIYETAVFDRWIHSRCLQFALMWLAIAGGNWKFLIYCVLQKDFRRGLFNVCQILCGMKRNRTFFRPNSEEETNFTD